MCRQAEYRNSLNNLEIDLLDESLSYQTQVSLKLAHSQLPDSHPVDGKHSCVFSRGWGVNASCSPTESDGQSDGWSG